MILLYFVIIIFLTILFLKYFRKTASQRRLQSARTLICIGSGGHTAEMMRILKKINPEKYSPRLYVMAGDDMTSEVKVDSFESDFCHKKGSFLVSRIYRSRKVGQSYFGSVFTTLYAALTSVPVVISFKPDVILCNGPGTCIPICIIAHFMSVVGLLDCKIVFIESICRVKTLSLSGKILLFITDIFAVQWINLLEQNQKIQYFGKLS